MCKTFNYEWSNIHRRIISVKKQSQKNDSRRLLMCHFMSLEYNAFG
jgi:hypothetical protein